MKQNSGFTLIQLSIILTVASLVFVATLPGVQTSLKSSAASVTKMYSILNAMRGYMAANGYLPCPADPTQALGAGNYGVAAANPGITNNCTGGAPAAAYADSTNHIAIGMVPVKTLGLSYADAVDGYGRDITYAVDTNATACWSSGSLTGAITVNDNGTSYNTVAALVSHGADGYGAWLPLSGSTGTASRFDNGSTDTAQADNAQVAHGGGLTANTTFASFVNKTATATFDDNVVYKSNLYTLNTLPTSAQQSTWPTVTPPANSTYSPGNTLTFTLAYTSTVTVNTTNGTPRLDLSAITGGSIGTGNVAYATYQSGSGTTTLTFQYTVQGAASAPNGISVAASIDLNGGTVSGGSTCFSAPNLSGVIIGPAGYYRTVTIDHTKVGTVGNTDQSSFPVLVAGTYTYLKTVANGGTVTNANGYDITFTSDAAGHNLLPFERESWSATTGAAVFWVQVPTVSHTADTVIYLQYGNSAITTDQSNKTGTWNSNYKGVWHLGETSGNPQDSTSYATSGTFNGTVTQGASGKFATSYHFGGGTGNYLDMGNPGDGHLNFGTGSFTYSIWIDMVSLPASNYSFLSKGGSSDPDIGYLLRVKSSSAIFPSLSDGTNNIQPASGCTLSTGQWTHLVVVVDRSAQKVRTYYNGAACGSGTSISSLGSVTTTDHVYMGADPNAANDSGLNGYLEEAEIVNTALSPDWISTEYNNQSAPDKATYGASGFYTVGAQTSR
jgi:hypothetical protein